MSDTDRIPTNLRTLLILEILGRADGAMSASQINERLGLPKQTVHRLCSTLEAEGFLIRQGKGRKYLPARRARELGAGLLYASRSHIARHQILMEVARQVRETINYVVPEDTGMSYLDRVETDWPFRIQLPIGSNVPFHCTASGKVFMASMTPRARKSFVTGLKLERLTHKTYTEAEELLDELALIARRGYAIDDEEFLDGMVAIAVPVCDSEGRFVAALAFHGPAQRVPIQEAVSKRGVLLDGARKLSEALFS